MKRFFTLLMILIGVIKMEAQEIVKINYEQRSFTKIEGGDPKMNKLMEDKFSEPVNYDLLLKDDFCLYSRIEKLNNQQSGHKMMIIGETKDIHILYNIKSNLTTIERTLDGKTYWIEDQLPKENWVITRESDQFLGFDVKKATRETEDYLYEVWFTTKLNFKCGPDNINGLPGTVLKSKETYKNDSNIYQTIYATDVTIGKTNKFPNLKPKSTISIKEYEKISEENSKRINEMYSTKEGVDKKD